SGWTGRSAIFRFQILSGGKTAHAPIRAPDGVRVRVLDTVAVGIAVGTPVCVAARVGVFGTWRVGANVGGIGGGPAGRVGAARATVRVGVAVRRVTLVGGPCGG